MKRSYIDAGHYGWASAGRDRHSVAAPAGRELLNRQEKGRYGDETVRSLAALVCGESVIERLTPQQLGELAFLLECAVRGSVSRRSLEAWLAQLAEREDRRAAAEAPRARLVEKVNEVELGAAGAKAA